MLRGRAVFSSIGVNCRRGHWLLFSIVLLACTNCALGFQRRGPSICVQTGELYSSGLNPAPLPPRLNSTLVEMQAGIAVREGEQVDAVERCQAAFARSPAALTELHGGIEGPTAVRARNMLETAKARAASRLSEFRSGLERAVNTIRTAREEARSGTSAALLSSTVSSQLTASIVKWGELTASPHPSLALIRVTFLSYVSYPYSFNTTSQVAPPCPAWAQSEEAIACSSKVSVGEPLSYCAASVPLPSLLRSFFSASQTGAEVSASTSPSLSLVQAGSNGVEVGGGQCGAVPMKCFDASGVFTPSSQVCSKPGFDSATSCTACLGGQEGDECRTATSDPACNTSQQAAATDASSPCLCSSSPPLVGASTTAIANYSLVDIYRDPTGDNNDEMGLGAVALAFDGRVLIAASHKATSQRGHLSVWLKNSTTASSEASASSDGLAGYVYSQKLEAPDGGSNDVLGMGGPSLSRDGRILCAAAHMQDGTGTNSGMLHVWVWNDTVSQYEYLQSALSPDLVQYDYLGEGGAALTCNGSTLAVGAPGMDTYGDSSGGVIVWKWREGNSTSNGGYEYLQTLTQSTTNNNDGLGKGGVTLSCDGAYLAAAAHEHDSPTNQEGSIFVWVWNSTESLYLHSQSLSAAGASVQSFLGKGGPHLTCNGLYLIGGAEGQDIGGANGVGAVHVWKRAEGDHTFEYLERLVPPDATSDDKVGAGVYASCSGNLLFATSPDEDAQGTSNIGALHVWARNETSGSYTYMQKMTPPLTAASSHEYKMGTGSPAVTNDGGIAAIGAAGDDERGWSAGAVLVWKTVLE